jgi:DNA-binding MarR family transcriptional regulator
MPRGIKSNAELDFLTAIESGEVVTQLALKRRVGVSVGLVNALLKRAVSKGYVKVRQAPYRRYAYYLTPQGFGEKSRLVAKYLETSLSFFREARSQYGEIFVRARETGADRLVLVGSGELAEIALLAASAESVSVLAIVDPQAQGSHSRTFWGHGVAIVPALNDVEGYDGVVITDASTPQKTFERLRDSCPEARIFAPAVLRLAPDKQDLIATAVRGGDDT